MQIDISCDMGESFGPWKMGFDEEMMQYISSANIAGGFHAGIERYVVKRAGISRQTVVVRYAARCGDQIVCAKYAVSQE